MLDIFFQFLIYGGLPLLFILVFLEGNPIIGSFIPGQILVILIGFMIATTKFLNLYWTLFFVFLGGLLGDIFGYFLGKRYGLKGLSKFGLDKNSKVYNSSKKFFKKLGPLSIILGREFNLTRAFIPFFAGLFNISKYEFFLFAIISNLIWTFLSIYLGYYFGIVIVDKITFLFEFITLIVIYIIIIKIVYNTFISFHEKNYILHKHYGLKNISFISFTLIFLIIFLFYGKWNNILLFNEYFNFLFFPSLFFINSIIFSKYFLFLILWIIFMILIFKQNIKLIAIFLWGAIITLFITFLFNLILIKLFNISSDVFIVFFTLLIFYLFIIFYNYSNNSKQKKYINRFLIILLLFSILVKYSQNANLYIIFLSFFIGTINCEFIILLSHYQILDKSLSEIINKPN